MSICLVDFWEKSKTPLKCFIKSRVSNDADSEDILQEVFLKLISNIDKLMDNQKVHAWIYKITKNAIIDYYRRNRRYAEFECLPEETHFASEDDFSLNHEIAFCLMSMVEKLPDIYKQAIVFTAFENHTQKEYSEKAGVSLSGAKSRVQRARSLLKEMVLDCCSLEFDCFGNIISYQKRSANCQYC